MALVVTELTMSLDGYIAYDSGHVGPLFDWYGNGDVEVVSGDGKRSFHVSAASAAHIQSGEEEIGAYVIGRKLFDFTNGWGGVSPSGPHIPVYVVTHSMPDGWPREDANFTIVLDGLESAIKQASEAAGDKVVGVAGPNLVQQCLNLGLLDEVRIDLVPVILGEGIPFFANLKDLPVLLDGPTLTEGKRVTHLRYTVRR
jgi:dihydrofolate reductase